MTPRPLRIFRGRPLDETLGQLLNELFRCKGFLRVLRVLGGKHGLRSRGASPITIVLPGGTRYELASPFFSQADRQGRRKRKRGPGKHRAVTWRWSCSHRLQYAAFKAKAIPCSSGIVESAIRRVINLRVSRILLRGMRQPARSCWQLSLLYGRWHHLVHSWKRDLKDEFGAISANIHPSARYATLKKAAA